MTVIRGHRVGSLPRLATRIADFGTTVLGPDLPGAACKGAGEPLWDDRVDGEDGRRRAERHELAIAICGSCPDITACLAARLADRDLGAGVWGGRAFGLGDAPQKKCRCGCELPQGAKDHCSRVCRERRQYARKIRRRAAA